MQDENGDGGGELMAQGAAAHQVLNHKRELHHNQGTIVCGVARQVHNHVTTSF